MTTILALIGGCSLLYGVFKLGWAGGRKDTEVRKYVHRMTGVTHKEDGECGPPP